MAGYDDDEDWVGTPPEGHYTRDRAKPEFWRFRWQATLAWLDRYLHPTPRVGG